jgi:hypothetical protein
MSLPSRCSKRVRRGGMAIMRYELLEVGMCGSHGDYDHRDTERYRVLSASGRERTYTLLIASREVQL